MVASILFIGFNACSSDDDETNPPSNSLRSSDLKIWIDKDYSKTFKITSGSYTKSTQTLTAKAEDGTAFTFVLEFEDTDSSIRRNVEALTYNGTRYTLSPTYYFSYLEKDVVNESNDYPYYGIISEVQTTVSNGNNTLTFQGSITFYQ